MMNIKVLLVFLFSIFFLKPYAQINEDSFFIKKISDEILQNGQAHQNLYVLCKNIGQRLSGSAGMYKAEEWGVNTLTKASANATYKQECTVPHWIRGAKATAGFRTKNRNSFSDFNVASLGNAVGTGSKGITAKVIEIKSFDELEKNKNNIAGKIVFFNYHFDKKLLGGGYGDAVRYRATGPSQAAKYGALGVIVRSVTVANDDFPHTGALRYNDSFPKIPAVAIGTKQADFLSDDLRLRGFQDKNFYLQSNCKMLADTIAHNIIGELVGTQFPEEIITIGGHLDSWDLGEGAHDDGAGVVQSIEVLRALKALGYQPKRTIRVVLFANEENGGKGGNKYMEDAKMFNQKYIMAMETDGGGETPKGFFCGMTAAQFEKVKAWQNMFEPFGASYFTNSIGGGGGADIGPLQTAFKTPQFGLSTAGNRYFDYHHAATDVFENVHERELHMGAVVMAAMVYLVDKYGL
jgi:carboxypeptidase Q